jgi:adenine-specific DNA-methyltransferase
MDKMRMESVDMTAQNIERIGALFPNCITETMGEDGKMKKAINFDLLRQMLSSDVIEGDEAYEFTWVGKKNSIVEANKPIKKTLRPCKEESVDWDNTENLYIEGDNLEVLKLMQESYLGKVKMIYIDPPYNTGHDFVYPDSFIMDSDNYDDGTGYFDEDGNINYSRENSAAEGKYHSDWCSMMYSRLMLARNMLTNDGIVFISIDDNELFNLKKLCDEVFGASNFIAQLAVQLNPRGRNLDVFVAKTYESVLMYAMNYTNNSTVVGVEKEGKMVDEYNREDEQGKYRPIGLRNRNQAFNPQTRPNLYYPLYVNPTTKKVSTQHSEEFCDEVFPDAPDGTKTCWTWMKKKVEEENDLIIAERSGNEWRIFRKDYLIKDGEVSTTLVKSLWTENTINNDYGKKAIKELFGSNIMSFPKAPELIKKMIKIGTHSNSIVMDFFSGSATTAEAVLQLNAEDGGQRTFIMIQLPEPCDEKSLAYQEGFQTIAEIGKERIRRVGEKIRNDNPLTTHDLDIGFRVFKLDDTNMKDVYYSADEYDQGMLKGLESNIKEDRTDLDLLFGCLLEWGLPLSLPYTSEQIEGCTVHTYNNGDLITCFNENVPESVVKTIAKRQPLRAVFRDNSFINSPSKINVGEIFKLMAPDTRVKVI